MKLRERIVICFSITFVLFTLLLVIDLQFDIGYSGNRSFFPLRHGRVYIGDTGPDGYKSIFKAFQSRFGASVTGGAVDQLAINETENEPHDQFFDLMQYVLVYDKADGVLPTNPVVVYISEERSGAPTVAELLAISSDGTLQDQFHARISAREMYHENEPLVGAILHHMQTDEIVHVKEKEGGTQLKLIIHYKNGDRALFKPMRFPREQQTLTNHFYFTDYERHNAEIAAFHLDKVLGFRRAMPVTGRLLNLTSELYEIGDTNLLKTFFVSPANNLCFHGHCSYYCDTSHAVCGNPDMLEGSFAAFLPEKHVVDRTLKKHPWRRSYHKRKKAAWETDPNYCENVKLTPPYDQGVILLDLIDTCIFDFLTGNMDRHHFETFSVFGNFSFPIHLDHGRAFGRPFHDEVSILAPLTQCCLIKHTTLKMLLNFHNGPQKLSEVMRASLQNDPLAPILWEPHYAAMDRRVKIILQAVRSCIQKAVEALEPEEPETTKTKGRPSKKLKILYPTNSMTNQN